MEQSLFIQYVNKYFPGVVVKIVSNLNDSTKLPTYLHRSMLKKVLSVTGKWEAITSNNSLVAADVVAMDSSLPLKKRDSIGKASGDIPKMGMELKLNEQQLTNLDTLIAQGGTEADVLAMLFSDTPKVIGGIYERNEAMFLQALSTGATLVEDTENVGTGIRVDFGYLAKNKFGVTVLWGTPAISNPIDDIERVLAQAISDGNTVVRAMMDKATFANFVKNEEVKQAFAFYAGFVGSNIPSPSVSKMNEATKDKWGFEIQIVDRSVKYEKNGIQTSVKPWAVGAVVFLTSEQVGTLTYARLAEQNHPVTGVSYEVADQYILVSKFRSNKPSLSEFTSSQARVVPVIAGVESIYLLDTTTVQA